MAALARKNLMVDAEQLRRLARRLALNESETVRYAIDRLLHEDEVMASAAIIRRRGGLLDISGRTTLPGDAAPDRASRNVQVRLPLEAVSR